MEKICLITEGVFLPPSVPVVRGGTIVLYGLVEKLQQLGKNCIVITRQYKERPNLEWVRRVKTYRLFSFQGKSFLNRLRNLWDLILKLLPLLRREAPDLLIANTYGTFLPSLIVGKLLEIKTVVNAAAFDMSLRRTLMETLLLSLPYDGILTPSISLKERIEAFAIAPVKNIGNARSFKVFKPMKQEKARQHLNLPKEKPILLYAGGLVKEKNLSFLLSVFKAFRRSSYDPLLVLVGSGPAEDKLKVLTNQLGLQEEVVFRGAVQHSSMPYYYNAADVFLLTSLTEGMPGSVIEALACNLPVVSTPVGDLPHLAEMEGIQTVNTIFDFSNALKKALKGEYNDLRERAKESYSWKHVTKELLEFVKGL